MSECQKQQVLGAAAAAGAAGTVNGLFGGAGGMILIPGLRTLAKIPDPRIFPTSVAVMLPTSLVSLIFTGLHTPLPVRESIPWLIGSALGGLAAGLWGKKIPALWLHRAFGAIMLVGGVRYLWLTLS